MTVPYVFLQKIFILITFLSTTKTINTWKSEGSRGEGHRVVSRGMGEIEIPHVFAPFVAQKESRAEGANKNKTYILNGTVL